MGYCVIELYCVVSDSNVRKQYSVNMPAKRGLKTYAELSPQQREFVDGIVERGLTNVAAYEEAGYYVGPSRNAVHQSAHKIRYNKHVDHVIRERLNKMVMSKEEALARQTAAGRFDMSDAIEVEPLVCPHCEGEIYEEGHARINVKKLKEMGLAHQIKKISTDRNGNQIIEFRDVDQAQDRILRATGAYTTQAEKEVGGLASLMSKALEMRHSGGSNQGEVE